MPDARNPISQSLGTVVEFVEGRLETTGFEMRLYRDGELERLLSEQKAPRYAHTGHTLYHYLIALDYRDPGDVLAAQGALGEFLQTQGLPYVASGRPREMFDLVLSAQPKWLDVDASLVQGLLASAPPFDKKSELKLWLRARLLEMFRYVKKPPAWLQSPNWPIGKKGPLVFLGQLAVEGYLHDRAAAYVFHDPASNECVTVLQTC
jgi:hypothetical protein